MNTIKGTYRVKKESKVKKQSSFPWMWIIGLPICLALMWSSGWLIGAGGAAV